MSPRALLGSTRSDDRRPSLGFKRRPVVACSARSRWVAYRFPKSTETDTGTRRTAEPGEASSTHGG